MYDKYGKVIEDTRVERLLRHPHELRMVLRELAAAKAEISRLTENQRLQDSATAAVLERAEKAEAELAALREDAERWNQLKALMEGAHAAFLSVNEHRLSYEEAPPEGPVYLQWYPITPVSFYIVQAETIDAAIDAAKERA